MHVSVCTGHLLLEEATMNSVRGCDFSGNPIVVEVRKPNVGLAEPCKTGGKTKDGLEVSCKPVILLDIPLWEGVVCAILPAHICRGDQKSLVSKIKPCMCQYRPPCGSYDEQCERL